MAIRSVASMKEKLTKGMNLKDKLSFLTRISRYVNPIQFTVVTAENPTKSQILRNQADEMEQREKDYQELIDWLKEISKDEVKSI